MIKLFSAPSGVEIMRRRRQLARPPLPAHRRIAAAVDELEPRRLLTAPTLAPLPSSVTLYSGTSLQIPLDGFDADGDALTFARTLSNQSINATFTPSANRS